MVSVLLSALLVFLLTFKMSHQFVSVKLLQEKRKELCEAKCHKLQQSLWFQNLLPLLECPKKEDKAGQLKTGNEGTEQERRYQDVSDSILLYEHFLGGPSSVSPYRLLRTSDLTTKPWFHLNLTRVKAMCYKRNAHRLYLSVSGNKIVAIDITNPSRVDFIRTVVTAACAIDGEEDLLFATLRFKSLARMKTDGSSYTSIGNSKAITLAIHYEEKVVYFSTYFEIVCLTYSGNLVRKMANPTPKHGLGLGLLAGNLYLVEKRRIFRLNLPRFFEPWLTRTPWVMLKNDVSDVVDVVVAADRIYITFRDTATVEVAFPNASTVSVKSGFDTTPLSLLSMCAL